MLLNKTTGAAFLSLVAFLVPLPAAITVSTYTAAPPASGSYPDTGGIELTDGITDTVVWGQGINPTSEQMAPLSGWLNVDPSITFNFSETVTIRSFTLWAADSDNYAGVGIPASVTLRTDDSSFSETFILVNPPGNGTTVPFTFSGFSVTSNQLILDINPGYQWTMLTEVQFYAIPEPMHLGLGIGLGALLVAFTRRRR